MANTRMTLGAVLGSVQEAATSVSATFNTVTKGVNMLNRYVSDAAEKQQVRSVIDMHDFKEKLVEEKAMEETMRKKQILEFTNQSEINKELYQASYNRLQELLKTA